MKNFLKYLFALISICSSVGINAQGTWLHGLLNDGLSNSDVNDTLSQNMVAESAYVLCNNKVEIQTTNDVFGIHHTTQWYSFQFNGENTTEISFLATPCGSVPINLQSDSIFLYGPFGSNNPTLLNEDAPLISMGSATNAIGLVSSYLATLSQGYYFIKYELVSKFGGVNNLCTTVEMLGGGCFSGVACQSNLTTLSQDEYRICNSMSCNENLTVCDDNARLFWYYDPTCIHVEDLHRVWLSTHVSNPSAFGMSVSYISNFPEDWKANVVEVNFYPTATFLGDCSGIGCGGSYVHCIGGSATWNYSTSYGALSSSDYLVEIVWSTSRAPKDQCNIASVVKFIGASCPQQIFLSDWGFSSDGSGNVSIGEGNFCENCLPRLMPEPNKKYVLEAWASQGSIPFGSQSLTHPKMEVKVHHSSSSTVDVYSCVPSSIHPIIDEWQLMTLEFTTPADIDFVDVSLYSDDGSLVYFDDVRFFPFDGSMKTYVYDPVTLRFVAELDERHFATIYEYDEEGKLMRVKKETERGVMTIQETHNSTVKQP